MNQKDNELIAEAYLKIFEAKKSKKAKPDYLDVDKDGNKKEPMKKALEEAMQCKYAKEGCKCDCGCKDCKSNQKKAD